MFLVKYAVTGLLSVTGHQLVEIDAPDAPRIESSVEAPKKRRVKVRVRADMVVPKTPASSPRNLKLACKPLPNVEEFDEDDDDWWLIGEGEDISIVKEEEIEDIEETGIVKISKKPIEIKYDDEI